MEGVVAEIARGGATGGGSVDGGVEAVDLGGRSKGKDGHGVEAWEGGFGHDADVDVGVDGP